MNEWRSYSFSDFVEINPKVILKHALPYSFVEMKDLDPNNKYCEPSAKRTLSGGTRFKENDTLFARITPCLENGKICKVRKLNNGVGFGSTEFHVLRGKQGISDNDFVYYLSRWSEVREFAEINLHGTSGRQRVPKEAFHELTLLLPPLHEQRAIAEVLSSLDDKIDLLHRNNKTLEEMAEVLFRKWFMEDVDETYTEKPLDEIASYLNGLALQKYLPKEGEEPLVVIKIKEMNNGISENSDYCSSNLPEQYIVNPGDILFSWSGSLEIMIWTQSKGALNQHLFKVTSDIYPKWMIYFATKHFIPLFRDIAADKATTMGHIQRKHLSEALLAIPPGPLLKTIDAIIDPIFEKLIQNKINIHHLVNTRDLLLPKLMSGAVRVKPFVNEMQEP